MIQHFSLNALIVRSLHIRSVNFHEALEATYHSSLLSSVQQLSPKQLKTLSGNDAHQKEAHC